MSIAAVIRALALLAESLVGQRVPKKMLSEQGAPTAADRRAIQEGIEELLWLAALGIVDNSVQMAVELLLPVFERCRIHAIPLARPSRGGHGTDVPITA